MFSKLFDSNRSRADKALLIKNMHDTSFDSEDEGKSGELPQSKGKDRSKSDYRNRDTYRSLTSKEKPPKDGHSPIKINEIFVDCVSKHFQFLCPQCK